MSLYNSDIWGFMAKLGPGSIFITYVNVFCGILLKFNALKSSVFRKLMFFFRLLKFSLARP